MKFTDKAVMPPVTFNPDLIKNVPAELAAIPYWCSWKWTWDSPKGKWAKRPYAPKTGRAARSNHPEDFVSMEQALAHQRTAGQSGIGLMPFGNIVAVDLDESIIDGDRLTPDAEAIVKLLHSYTEISPSGTGLHILLKASTTLDKNRYYVRNDSKHVECYSSRWSPQYMTCTGAVFRGMSDFGDRTAEFQTLLNTYMLRSGIVTGGQPAASSKSASYQPVNMTPLSDAEVIAKASAAKNGDKFSRLWAGDISDYATADCTGYSEADEALLCMLAYWTRKDEAQTERLFLQSGLCREKTTKQRGYLSGSMKKAFARVQTVYDPNYRSSAREDFSPPAPSGKVTGGQPQQTRPEWPEFTPLTNADAIADQMPDFPVDALPPVQREYVLAVAKQMKADPCMVAAGVLASGASAIQGVIDFSPRKGWNTNGTEATPLWALSIMESGGGKSRVNNEIRSHIDEWQKQLNKKMQNAIADSEANLKFANSEMKRLMSAQQRTKSGEEDCVTAQRIREAERKVKDAERNVIHPVTLTCGNCTTERLLEMMRDQYFHRITVITSEAGVLKTWAGRYSDGKPDVSAQCNAYMGEHAEDNRRCEDRVVDAAHLSIMIYGQWNALADAMTNEVFMDQGLLARFLYVFPKEIEDDAEEEEEYEVPEAIRMEYRSSLWELFRCTSPTVISNEFNEDGEDEGDRIELPEKKTIYFSPEATALWKGPIFRAQQQKEKWAKLEGDLIIKWTKRYRGTIGRIASVLHAFKLGADMTVELLDADTLTDAWRITDYFFETAKAAFSYSPAAPKIVNARYVWTKIRTAAPDESGNITTRNLWRQQCHTKFKDEREDFDAALDELQRRGYIKRMRIQTDGRSSEILRINPEATQD